MQVTRWALLGVGLILVGLSTTFVWFLLPSDDVPRAPDAVIVLGGAYPERTELGIELAEQFDVLLVLSSSASIYGRLQGRTCSTDAACFEPSPETTRGEAQTFARIADEAGWQHVTVVTSAFHTSRSRLLFRQCLGDRVSVVGAVPDGRFGTNPRLLLREGLGVIAGVTFQRAC